VVVYNRSRQAVEELVAEGAFSANSPAEVARKVKVVFTNLPDTPDVIRVVLGEKGIIHGVHPGLIYVDNSTIKPDAAREMAEKLEAVGIASLDAPVSGGDIGARDGTLTIMVGGSKEAFETVKPIFQAMGKTITHIGDPGAGQIAKAANQIMVAAQMVAMGELMIFAQKCGTDPRKVVEAISAGSARCWALDVKPGRLFEGNRAPGFKAKLQSKDLGIVMDTARLHGVPLPGTAINSQLFQAMVDSGLGEMDNSGVISIIEMMAGVQLDVVNSGDTTTAKPVSTTETSKPKEIPNSPPKKDIQPIQAEKPIPPTNQAKVVVAAKTIMDEPAAPTTKETLPSPSPKQEVVPPKMKETPPFIEVPPNSQSEKIRASRSKTTPLK
jgi:2-hydroxy-3-oxopropionate reductase